MKGEEYGKDRTKNSTWFYGTIAKWADFIWWYEAKIENRIKIWILPIDTPIIEYAEVLLAKAGGETEKQIYRFEKGDTDLALRFDLTVPLAKYVAKNYGNLSFPFRRYQIGKVYRGEKHKREDIESFINVILI